jgi:hypothetical protein
MTEKKKPRGKKGKARKMESGPQPSPSADFFTNLPEWKMEDSELLDIGSLDLPDVNELFAGVTLEDLQGLPPQEKVGTEGERRGSVKDVAEWMLNELKKSEMLYQSYAVSAILQHFGGGFIYPNRQDNYAIDVEVLKHFRTLTEKTVVWVRRQKFWRWRQEGDPPGKREVQ